MAKLLFDPLARLLAVTAIDDPPGLEPGDRVTVTLRVDQVDRVPVRPGQAFWTLVLIPYGPALTVGANPVYVETEAIPLKEAGP